MSWVQQSVPERKLLPPPVGQLSVPQIRPDWHWLSSSQSPSFSPHPPGLISQHSLWSGDVDLQS